MKWGLPAIARRAINAVPDINSQSDEVQAVTGILGSLLVHIFLLLLWLLIQGGAFEPLFQNITQKDVPIEIVIQTISVLPERIVTTLDQLKDKSRIDSAGLSEAAEAPKNAPFESDKNLQAGSKEVPRGSSLIPQINANERTVDRSLVQRDARVGSETANASNSGNAAKPPPDLTRLGTNAPLSKTASSKVSALGKKRTPQQQPQAADNGRTEDVEDLGGELVFRKVAAGVAAPVKVSETVGTGKKQKAVDEIPEDESQEGRQQSKTDGGLAQNGKVGVNASKAPMAVYMKSVSRAIGARWNVLVKSKNDSLDTGSARVKFRVAMDGSIKEVKLEKCTANQEFADLCVEVVRQCELDPPPSEASPLLRDGLLEIPFTFSLY
jgi:TonB family protein